MQFHNVMISFLFIFLAYTVQDSGLSIKVDNPRVNPKDSLLAVNVHFLNSSGKKLKFVELHSTARNEVCHAPGWAILVSHQDPNSNEIIQYYLAGALCRSPQITLLNNEEYNVRFFINFRYLYNSYSRHWPNINRDYGEYEIQLKLCPFKSDTIASNKIKICYEENN